MQVLIDVLAREFLKRGERSEGRCGFLSEGRDIDDIQLDDVGLGEGVRQEGPLESGCCRSKRQPWVCVGEETQPTTLSGILRFAEDFPHGRSVDGGRELRVGGSDD